MSEKSGPSLIELQEAKRIIEALLFASNEPLSLQKIREIIETAFPIGTKELRKIIEEMQTEYTEERRAFCLEMIADGYVLRSHASYSPYVQLLFTNRKKKERLSQAALETLAIIAYKQPVTKAQIELIRGVDSSGVLQHLQERQLIEVTGKLEAPGRPSLFATTREFLKYFGLKNLTDLPATV
jgi:segregation and condensation protein B